MLPLSRVPWEVSLCRYCVIFAYLAHKLPLTGVQRIIRVPPRSQLGAPNIQRHLFRGCPKYSRAMHATSLGNPNSTGPLRPLRLSMMLGLHASCTPHAWDSLALGSHLSFIVICYLNEILGPTLQDFHFIPSADDRSYPSTGEVRYWSPTSGLG